MKRIFFLYGLLLFSAPVWAQNNISQRFSVGFFVGFESQFLGIDNFFSLQPERWAYSPVSSRGASIGIFARKQVLPWLAFQPELSTTYLSNRVQFSADPPQMYRFWDVEVPLHFAITDVRKANAPLRGCILIGGRLGWNMVQNPSNLLHVSQEWAALDLGLGADIKWGTWHIQPSFIFAHGLNDLHILGKGSYDTVVGSILRDKFSFRVYMWRKKRKK